MFYGNLWMITKLFFHQILFSFYIKFYIYFITCYQHNVLGRKREEFIYKNFYGYIIFFQTLLFQKVYKKWYIIVFYYYFDLLYLITKNYVSYTLYDQARSCSR